MRVGHAVHVVKQGGQNFVQFLLWILGHRQAVLSACDIETLRLERRQADLLDAAARLGRSPPMAGERGQDLAQSQALPRKHRRWQQDHLRG